MINFRPHEKIAGHRSVFLSALDQAADDGITHTDCAPPEANEPTADQLIGLSKRISALRLRRHDLFSPELFGEPGWDMLLALFNAGAGGHKMTVSSLCAASQSPDTTALRWLERLVQLELIERVKSPFDGRVTFVVLRPAGQSAISGYLREVWDGLFAAD